MKMMPLCPARRTRWGYSPLAVKKRVYCLVGNSRQAAPEPLLSLKMVQASAKRIANPENNGDETATRLISMES